MNIFQYFDSFQATLNHPFNRSKKLKTIFRIIFWKINQWFFRLPAIIEIDTCIKCVCYPDSSYGGMIVYNRWAEYELMANIVKILKPDSIYFDIGANIGDTTIIAAAHTSKKIYAFEPSPVAYPRLLENIRLNNLQDQIISERKVLSEKVGKIEFSETKTSETSHIGVEKNEVGGKTIKIDSTTLDLYCAKMGVKRIDLIKIDVEGAEMLVLLGATHLLEKKMIKCLLIELNSASSMYGYKNSDVVTMLKKYGYKTTKIPPDVNSKITNITAYVK